MLRRRKALAVAALLLALAPGVWGVLDGLRPVARGLNDAGGEFVRDYRDAPVFSSPHTLDWMAEAGFDVVRLPFRWESVQPELNGPLAPESLEALRRYVQEAHARGLGVILDPHNMARYVGVDGTEGIVSEQIPIAAFADFWRRMSREFGREPGIYAYGLMNEPNHIVTKKWEAASQAAVDAIRAEGDATRILVPGSNYSSTHVWQMCHGRDHWIRDPLDNFAYEAHCYFDRTGSGHYALSYEEEARLDPQFEERTEKRLQTFVDWCEYNGVEGFIGEFGVPDDPRWQPHLDRFLALMDRSRMGGTAWAAGEAWPANYHLLVEPGKPQLEVVRAHNGRTAPDFLRGYRVLYRRLYQTARQIRDALR